MSPKLQLYGFVAVVILLAGLVGWSGLAAWQELTLLRNNFASVPSYRFHMAEHVEATISDLNEMVQRFDLYRNPEVRSNFDRESEKLLHDLQVQESPSLTENELKLINRIEQAYAEYLRQTAELLSERSAAGETAQPRPMLERVDARAEPVLNLCRELRVVERAAMSEFVQNSHEALSGLQRRLAASVALILVLGFTATRLIYRAKVAPLRAQLVRSRAILERQEKLASLGTLAAGVAHEIRNPLTAINVRVHTLKKTLASGSSEHEDVSVIDQEIRRLDRIVCDFLDFARPSEPRLVTIAVESLLNRVQGLLGPQWSDTAIRLIFEPPPLLWIRADPPQVEQVLINLIQNAADSIKGSGSINVCARPASAKLSGTTQPVVVLEVKDTGGGIPPEVQKRLFDPFFTTKESGTGLGLAIAASIIEKHGGALQYQTQVGRGTTFGILLPRVEKHEHENPIENPAG